ncbi:hypothetical protein GCM10010195_24720 [Kitasatospora griseola]|nr:hypothetical protein GCM10010195_24720 [Kitasatospora griseola]
MPGALALPENHDVLAREKAVRPSHQRAHPFRGLNPSVEQLGFHGVPVSTGGDLVHRPPGHSAPDGRPQERAVLGHLGDVPVYVHADGVFGAGFDEAERPGGRPGHSDAEFCAHR